MIRIEIVRSGGRETVTAEPGALLSDLLQLHGPFDLPCGGKGTCLRCRIRAEGVLSPLTPKEAAALSQAEQAQGWRLACMTQVLGDAVVHLQESAIAQIQQTGDMQTFALDLAYTQYGIAADIGTTTVCMRLYGPKGELLGSAARKNPQTAYGADVISRIEQALDSKSKELAEMIQQALGEMAAQLCKHANVSPVDINTGVITGNTVMLYLLVQHNPQPLAQAPFAADRLFGETLPANTLLESLPVAADAKIILPRCISAFVGADITTAILASGMCATDRSALLVDIGTNGEMALWHKGSLFVCSTAAGPAFEGVGLTCGTYGIAGAVDRVWLEDGCPRISTIGGADPIGICGSGAVDALAVMLACGAMDETGAMQEERFALGDGAVFISQKDVRQIQLAKGAVRAGMETLLHTAGLTWRDIETLYIAGGFGSYLSLESAGAIGLIPPELTPRTKVLGNAALTGAAMLLLNKGFAQELDAWLTQAQTVALDTSPVFMEQYMAQMLFGPMETE